MNWRLALLAGMAVLVEAVEEHAFRLPDPICCALDYERRLDFSVGAAAVPGLGVRVIPAEVATASLEAIAGNRWRLHVLAHSDAPCRVELVGQDQAVRAGRRLQAVSIRSDCEKRIDSEGKTEDGSTIFVGTLFLRPYVAGLDVRFACLGRNLHLPDGLGERWIASETFTQDARTGEASTSFRFLREPGGKWVPFTYIIYQDGEQVSAP